MDSLRILFAIIPTVFGLIAITLLGVAILDRRAVAARWACAGFAIGAVGVVLDAIRPPGSVWLLVFVHLAIITCLVKALAVQARIRVPRMTLAGLALTAAAYGLALVTDQSINARTLVFHIGIALSLLPLLAAIEGEPGEPARTIVWAATGIAALTYLARIAILIVSPVTESLHDRETFFDIPINILFHALTGLSGLILGLALLFAFGLDAINRESVRVRTDPLTRLGNRYALAEAIDSDRKGLWRCGGVLSVDLDHFKRVNDTHGHEVGDALLVAASGALVATLGAVGRLCRVGGEEFVVLVDDAVAVELAALGEAARAAVAAIELGAPGATVRATASVGWSRRKGDEPIEAIIRHADRALYEAKENGRNRVAAAL